MYNPIQTNKRRTNSHDANHIRRSVIPVVCVRGQRHWRCLCARPVRDAEAAGTAIAAGMQGVACGVPLRKQRQGLSLGVGLRSELNAVLSGRMPQSAPHATNPEYDAFTRTMDKLLSVSHDELKRRMEAYKKQAAKNPRRRGPKPKAKADHCT